jgi:tetraacyldisaccharide 4'-kinase
MRAPDFWTSNGLAARACAALLAPLGALYGLSIRARQARAQPFRSKARVLCVGNLTAGGSGKTPVAMALARMLAARGHRIVFLSRGYRGRLSGPVLVDPAKHSAADVGDEPLLLAAVAPTIVARDRARGAALADSLGASVIVMDDGFQNFQLVKDLSFLVVDSETGFGNRRLIPAGPLREPVEQGLQRADAVVLMGDGALMLASFRGPIFRAVLRPSSPDRFEGRSVFAMAGIGRPEKFFHTLEAMGARIAGTKAFPDHHRYTVPELDAVRRIAADSGALPVTTEKDFVRIDANRRDGILPVPVHAAFADDPNLGMMLDSLAAGRA